MGVSIPKPQKRDKSQDEGKIADVDPFRAGRPR
jgi:hypothetical protein